jgi:hypothetical protein
MASPEGLGYCEKAQARLDRAGWVDTIGGDE